MTKYEELPYEEQQKYISKSKYKLYMFCPAAYEFKYLNRIKEPSYPWYEFGKQVHKIIQDYFEKVEIHDNALIVPELEYPEKMRNYVHNFLTFEINRWKKIYEQKNGEAKKYYMPVIVEQEILVENPKFIAIPDRIHLTLNDEHIIVENKSGLPKIIWAKSYEEDLMMYKIILRNIYDIKRGSIYYPSTNFVDKIEFNDNRLKIFEEKVNLVRELIEKKIFIATPSQEKCRGCSFNKICGSSLA